MNPLDERKQQGSKRFSLAPLWGKIALLLYTGTAEVQAKAESDGKLTVSNYGKAGSTSTAISLETTGEQKTTLYGKAGSTITAVGVEATTGEQRNVLIGHDGAALQRVKVETTRELDVVFEGKDSGGTVDPVRTNDNQQLFYEPYEKWIQKDPVELTNADAIIFNPGAAATETYSVIMTVYAFTAGAAAVSIYIDVAAGGTAGNNEYLMNAEALVAKTRVTLPEIIIGGDDDIRGFTTAGNDATVHFKVKQVART